MTIYYVYRRDNGEFSGSGITPIDTAEYASTTAAPEDEGVPALVWDALRERWVVRTVGQEVLSWVAGEVVAAGDRRIYGDLIYTALQGHTTQADWTPPATPALWKLDESMIGEWRQYTYAIDTIVIHNDITWQSRRNNNSWEPGTNDSGWLQIAPLPGDWYYLGSEGYPFDWQVLHNGQLWQNQQANNFWEPGVFGWVVV